MYQALAVCCLQVDLTRKRLERAGKLTSGLADEGIRWQATADQLQTQTELLVGDVFLSAACIAYYGAFTGSYRYVSAFGSTSAVMHSAVQLFA
jgi:hypothetical protein